MSYRLIQVEDYEPLVGAKTIERVLSKAAALRGFHVTNINSTYYGGGVAELLSSMTLLMNGLGIETGWRVLQGSPDFFGITKKMHNALQGMPINFSRVKREIYENVVFENSVRNHLDHDLVIVHDPQPLPLICHYKKRSPWVWRCHIDLSSPHRELWSYLVPFVEKYDAVIFSIPEYAQTLKTPQIFFMPAIDPFTTKNRQLRDEEMDERLAHYGIPTDLPLVVQVSRFDPWKDPKGVIEAFRIARKEVDCTLVLLGNFASDDPEGAEIYESLVQCRDERILVLPHGDDTALVNTLAAAGGGGPAEVHSRGFRPDRHRSHVEGHARDRRQRGGDPPPDRRRGERFPGVLDRGSRATDGPALEGSRAPRADGREGPRDRGPTLLAHALPRAVPGPVQLVRGQLLPDRPAGRLVSAIPRRRGSAGSRPGDDHRPGSDHHPSRRMIRGRGEDR